MDIILLATSSTFAPKQLDKVKHRDSGALERGITKSCPCLYIAVWTKRIKASLLLGVFRVIVHHMVVWVTRRTLCFGPFGARVGNPNLLHT